MSVVPFEGMRIVAAFRDCVTAISVTSHGVELLFRVF
jgi:hypothetical protein